jgi:hypothetical protein
VTDESWKYKANANLGAQQREKWKSFPEILGAGVKHAKLTWPPKSSHLHISSLLPPPNASVCIKVAWGVRMRVLPLAV